MTTEDTAHELEQLAIVEDYISHLVWSAETPTEVRGAVEGNLRGFWSHINSIAMRAWPASITDDLRAILGMMVFDTMPVAHAYRDFDQADICRKVEHEQAFVLHRLLGFWFEHGGDWRRAAGEDLARIRAKRDAEVAA